MESESDSSHFKKFVFTFILLLIFSRLILFFFGMVTLQIDQTSPTPQIHKTNLSEMFISWDAHIYPRVAYHGYNVNKYTYTPTEYLDLGFFPFYAILIKIASLPLGLHPTQFQMELIAILVSNLALIVSAILLFRIARLYVSKESAELISLYLLCFPSGFFLSTSCAESVLLMFVLGSIYCGIHKSWGKAILFAFCAAFTKFTGIAVLLALLYLLIKEFLANPALRNYRAYVKFGFLFALPLLAPLLFSFYCYLLVGDFFAYFNLQHIAWKHHLSEPFSRLWSSLLYSTPSIRINALVCIIYLSSILIFWKKIPKPLAIYSFAFLLLTPISGETLGTIRYSAAAPALIYIFGLLTTSIRWKHIIIVSSVLLQAIVYMLWIRELVVVS